MIDAAQRARIRRLFYAEHWRIGTISAELGVHHDAVRNAIEADRFVRTGAQIRPTMLDPYKGLVEKILDDHPRLRATRLFEMICARGYPGSVVQLRRYVSSIRPQRTEAFLRLETLPGEQAQVDWGHFGTIQVGAAKRALSCFVLVLSWSRAIYARFALDQTLESFLRGHVLAFEALGGVPREILYDNLKSVVLERAGDHIRFHPRILDLAGHYHFAPKPCAPYRGNEKGKVERQIQYAMDCRNRPRAARAPSRRRPDCRRPARRRAAAAVAAARARDGPRAGPGRGVGQDALRAVRSQRLLDPAHAREEAAHARRRGTDRAHPRR
jgi:transposase